jgi:Na+-transporting methylmalonyl-CoA/oxaloacetate decarboxylase gamma subunit
MDDLGFGLWMTLFGMGTVFALLFLLMGILWLIGWEPRRSSDHQVQDPTPTTEAGLGADLSAAIMVAIAAYRRDQGGTPTKTRQIRRISEMSRWGQITRSMQHHHLPHRGQD